MVRNLGKMTAVGLVKRLGGAANLVIRKLSDEALLKRARIHPLAVLTARMVYAQGRGEKGGLTWQPALDIVGVCFGLQVESRARAGYISIMSTVAEIEAAIARLPRKELWELKERLDRRCEAEWDAQIQEDARSGGPLDRLAREAIAELNAGGCRPLP
jgi:hypothetical protein